MDHFLVSKERHSSKAFAGMLLWVGIFCGVEMQVFAASEVYEVVSENFLINNEPFVIRSGEMHYARIPMEYWPHRLKMARAMGLNTVSTYVFWNFHEPEAEQFDFSGRADIAEFCRLAQEEGLKVIVRPGPYVCAEWDFGGLPWWLLKDPEMKVRTRHPGFLEACRRYFLALGEQLAPLQITRGGPIIMVQVENEYDGYGRDQQYLGALMMYLKEAGFEVPFFTSEMAWTLKMSVHEDLLRTVGFSRDPQKYFQMLREIQPDGPLMCAEYYTGWFSRWGAQTARGGDYARGLEGLEWMLENGASFNLYMAHGGTTFGFNSGANFPPFYPQPTSYDYDAPISEAGWPTPKCHALRDLFSQHLADGEELPDIPPRNPVIEIAPFELEEVAPLFGNLPEPKILTRPKPMEALDQGHGCVLYRTELPAGPAERLRIRDLHDYGLVILDGEKIATLDRCLKQNSVMLPPREEEMTLDLLIEAFGRPNFGEYMEDRKGITERVDLIRGRVPREVTGWEIFNLPLDGGQLGRLKFETGKTGMPAYYRGEFQVSEIGDTFLDMSLWGKGVVWVNGHNLGRFWNLGPQQTLYCPGPWLKEGRNEVIVFELNGARLPVIAGLAEPILERLNLAGAGRVHRQPGQELDLSEAEPIHEGSFPPGRAWQTVEFEAPALGQYFCLEALNSQGEDIYTTIAELKLLGPEGKELNRSSWKIVYADSEEMSAEHGSAANVLDWNPDTFWHTQWETEKPEHPHHLVIDLGKEEILTGIRYLPRQDEPNGLIRDFRLYVSGKRFPGL